jgi:hypothetical protein
MARSKPQVGGYISRKSALKLVLDLMQPAAHHNYRILYQDGVFYAAVDDHLPGLCSPTTIIMHLRADTLELLAKAAFGIQT